MSRITIIGGTGYAGGAIAREAVGRGHAVKSVSRTIPDPDARIEGIEYEAGSMLDVEARLRAVTGSDVVISALSPRGELDGRIVEVDSALAALAGEHGIRLGVIGGFSSLRLSAGGPRIAEGDDLPPQFASEARQMHEVLTALSQTDDAVDWFFVSPAMTFGSHAPGEALGHHRLGADVAFFDEAGVSAISGADFAVAVIDEVERAAHRRAQFSVAY